MKIRCFALAVLAPCFCLVALPASSQTATATNFVTFSGTNASLPTSIVQASDGNFWGTTGTGGNTGAGTVFKATPAGAATTVFDFANSGTSDPISLIEGNDGNFYGVTHGTGTSGSYGGIFQLTPQGSFLFLTQFGAIADLAPNPQIIQGSDGNLYGSAADGIYAVNTAGAIMSTSDSLNTGANPSSAALVEATDGNLYGAVGISNDSDVYGGILSSPLGTLAETYVIVNNDGNHQYQYPGTEGADGALYFSTSGDILVRYVLGGTTVTATAPSVSGQALTAASDGNLYGFGGASLEQIAPGSTWAIAAIPLTGPVTYATFSSAIQGNDGALYTFGSDTNYSVIRVALSPALPPPVQMTASPTTITLGQSTTLSWKVMNATSKTFQQCNAFLSSPGNGGGDWTGLQTGTVAAGVYSGSATITPTAGGSYTYALTCGGVESGYATVTVSGGQPSSTTTTLVPASSVVTIGTTTSVTAYVNSMTGGYRPTGTVKFYCHSNLLGTVSVNSSGSATLTASTTGIPGGKYPIMALYSGDANDGASQSPPVVITLRAPTTTSLTASPTTIAQGLPTTLTATVRTTQGTPAPTGTVTFYYTLGGSTAEIGIVGLNASGVATIQGTIDNFAGTYSLTAVYSGDTLNLGSTSSAVSLTVTATTQTTLRASDTTITNGQYLSFFAIVAAPSQNPSDTITGTVTFSLGSLVLATAPVTAGLNGTETYVGIATLLVDGVTPGTYAVTATYNGSAAFAASTSTAVSVTVTE